MAQFSTLQATTEQGKYTNGSASALIATGAGVLVGIVINSHSSGTIKFWDALTATGTVIFNTMTLVAGERFVPLYGAKFTTGCYLTIGGTIDYTVITN